MADGFDPCECVWNHEHAMQRLINLVSLYMIAIELCIPYIFLLVLFQLISLIGCN